MRDDAIHIATDTSKPQALRDEACGMIKTADTLLDLPDEIAAFQALIYPPKEGE